MGEPLTIDLGDDVGHLRLRLLPATQTAVVRVHITTRGIADGPLVNNAADLVALGRAFAETCERYAVHLHPGTPRTGQRTLFDQEATG